MKLDYFGQETADEDDRMLIIMINQDAVPSTCLLSGFQVQGFFYENVDPCNGCLGPRDKCQGRVPI